LPAQVTCDLCDRGRRIIQCIRLPDREDEQKPGARVPGPDDYRRRKATRASGSRSEVSASDYRIAAGLSDHYPCQCPNLPPVSQRRGRQGHRRGRRKSGEAQRNTARRAMTNSTISARGRVSCQLADATGDPVRGAAPWVASILHVNSTLRFSLETRALRQKSHRLVNSANSAPLRFVQKPFRAHDLPGPADLAKGLDAGLLPRG
jgi:hypothetical protein